VKKHIDILITCDIDPTPEASIEDKREALRRCGDLFNEMGIKATFYTVGNIAADYQTELLELMENGHEIGCHGLTHDNDEEYSTLSYERAKDYLSRAKTAIENVTGVAVRAFRGPRVKTSHRTQQALEELGFTSDSSVCPQRIDFISSNLINPHWITAPRKTYRPHIKSAFKRGQRNLAVIPVSALVMPFISGMLYIFGFLMMRIFFKLLCFESRITGKPIVYLLHPSEYAPMTKAVKHEQSAKAILARGFYFRRHLKLRHTPEDRFQLTRRLLEAMVKTDRIKFLTATDYAESFLDPR